MLKCPYLTLLTFGILAGDDGRHRIICSTLVSPSRRVASARPEWALLHLCTSSPMSQRGKSSRAAETKSRGSLKQTGDPRINKTNHRVRSYAVLTIKCLPSKPRIFPEPRTNDETPFSWYGDLRAPPHMACMSESESYCTTPVSPHSPFELTYNSVPSTIQRLLIKVRGLPSSFSLHLVVLSLGPRMR